MKSDTSKKRRKPYIGVTVSKFQGFMPSTLISGLRLLGVEFVEINNSIFPEVDSVVKSLGNMVTAFHLPLVVEDGWDFSCHDHKMKIEDAIYTLNKYRDSLKIQHLVAHPPEPHAIHLKQNSSLDYLLENLSKLNLPVYLENVPQVTLENYLEIYKKAKERLGKQLAGMCFDAPHYFITGYDPIEQYVNFNQNIGCIHLSDCYRNSDLHIPFNSGGSLPVESFLKTVKENNFSGYLTLEIKPHSLRELNSYIESYLKTLQYLNYNKYLVSKLRVNTIKPIISKFAS